MTTIGNDEFDDEFADLTIPVHAANSNKLKRIGIEVDVTSIKGIMTVIFRYYTSLYRIEFRFVKSMKKFFHFFVSDELQTKASSCTELKTGLLRDIKNKSEELRKETAKCEGHALMLQNLIKLDRGELPTTDPHFQETTEMAKTHGAKATQVVTEQNEAAQKKVDLSRASVIKMRGQLQVISQTTKSNTTTGNDVFMKANRFVKISFC